MNDLNRYLAGDMQAADLLAIDDHIAACSECRTLAMERGGTTAAVVAHALSARLPEHLTFDEIAAFLDEDADVNLRQRVETHIGACDECRREVDDLRGLSSPAPDAVFGAVRPYASTGPRTFWYGWAIAAAAAVVLIAVVVWSFLRTAPADQPLTVNANVEAPPTTGPTADVAAADPDTTSPEPSPGPAVALVDGGKEIGVGPNGELVGLEGVPQNYARLVRSAFRGTISVNPEVRDLVNVPAARMGDSDGESTSFAIDGPKGKIIDTTTPRFSWKPLAGTEAYRVEVYDLDFNQVATSGEMKGTTWTTALDRGRTYIWQVTAVKDGREYRAPSAPAPEARFRILDEKRSRDLAALRMRRPRSNLLLAVAYADAGLTDAALRELEQLAKQNPQSPTVQTLVARLKAATTAGRR